MEDAIAESSGKPEKTPPTTAAPATVVAGPTPPAPPARAPRKDRVPLPLRRMLAYARNEATQIRRDPIRLTFAFVGSAVLMLVFGFGITTDVEDIRYATLDRDRTPESRAYLEELAGASRYFTTMPAATSDDDGLDRLRSGDISFLVEIPPGLGRDVRRGAGPEILVHVDGAMPYRAETIAQYARGVHSTLLQHRGNALGAPPPRFTASIEGRYMYNPTFESIYTIVPSVPALLLILIPAILMTVSIVREKELGSIINFYVTPTGRLEYLLGKQLPYVAIGMINYFILVALAAIVFGVWIKGSFLVLTACTFLYVVVTTGIGMVTSTFTKTQVAAVFVTAILTIQPTIQFAGLLQPVSTLEGGARLIGTIWPTTYYMHSSVGAYTKGLAPGLMMHDLVVLACAIPILLAVSVFGLKKQDT